MTKPSVIMETFVEAYDAFILIEGHPTNSDVNKVFEALSHFLCPIKYGQTDAVHNLIGIIQDDDTHKTKHGSSFPLPKRPKIFDETINGSLSIAIVTRKKEAAHASLQADWVVYNMAKRKIGRFILKVVDHVWLSKFSKGLPT